MCRNTTLKYEKKMNKNIPFLFVCVSAVTVQSLSRVCKLKKKLKKKNEIQTKRIKNTSV